MIISSVTQLHPPQGRSLVYARYFILIKMYIYYILSPKDTVSQITINTSLIISYTVCKLFYWLGGIKISGSIGKIQANERYIIIANHTSRHDAPMIISSLPFKAFKKMLPIRFFTAEKELYKKYTGVIIRMCGGFRSHSVKDKISGLHGGLTLSDNEETLFMFPQGKMVKNKHEFMTGVAYLVKKRNFHIIPTYVSVANGKKKVVFGKSFELTQKQTCLDDIDLTQLLQKRVYSLKKK